jgi:hypothetical protein
MNFWYNDDILQRIFILWTMAVFLVYGNNAPLIENIFHLRLSVGVYLAMRLSVVLAHTVYSMSSYQYRVQQRLWIMMNLIGVFLCAPLFSNHISLRNKIPFTVITIISEECMWVLCYSSLPARIFHTPYSQAIDSVHSKERYRGLFFIGLSEFLYTLILSSAASGVHLSLLHGLWTLVIAFGLNWIYLNYDGSLQYIHPVGHKFSTGMTWILLHHLLLASLIAGGRVAAAISTKNEKVTMARAWLLCGSLSLTIYILYILALLQVSQDPAGRLIFPKQLRLIMRPIIGLIFLMLPLIHGRYHLGFTAILSTITGLIIFCVIWESLTSLQRDGRIREPWKDRKFPLCDGHRSYALEAFFYPSKASCV